MELQEHAATSGSGATRAVRRPAAVVLVALLGLGLGAYHVAHAIIVLIDRENASAVAEGAFDLALGMLAIVIAVEALRMRRWAWVAFMTWALVGLVHQLVRHFFYDNVDYLAMALDAAAVLVLTPLDIQIAFGVRPPRSVVLDPHPGIPASSSDFEVVRAFEPIVRYTKGEAFYPMAVEPYLRESSLWLYVPDGADEEQSPRVS